MKKYVIGTLLGALIGTASGYYMRRFLSTSKCKADEEEPWSYREKNGPKKWGKRYPTCNGLEQSPINIKSYEAVFNSALPKLALKNYDVPVKRATIENNGHTIEVTPSDGVERSIHVNGDVYNLEQLHFHWGDSGDCGSEHTLNGVQYSMELHFVHRNARREVAVVAVFFQEQAKKNTELQNILSHFPKVMYRDGRTELKSPLNLNHFLPSNPSSYFRYKGSLTTPACAQGVTWSVLTLPLPVGKEQMKEFRKLYSVKKSEASKSCRLTDNYRPVQPLNKRTVYISQ